MRVHVGAEEQVQEDAGFVRVRAIAPLPPPHTQAAKGPYPSTCLLQSGPQVQKNSRQEKLTNRLHPQRTSFRLPYSSKSTWRELAEGSRLSW